MTATVQGPVLNRAHGHAAPTVPSGLVPRIKSADPDDFPVPSGREEEWRFTPLRRLRGLHDHAGATVGVTYSSTSDLVEVVERTDPRLAGFLATDRPAARAWAGFATAAVVQVPARADGAPQRVALQVGATGGTAFGHVLVDVAPLANAVVVIDHVGDAAYAGSIDVRVGDGAQLVLSSLQSWSAGAVHLGQQHARLGRDARFRSVVVTLGGDLVRLTPTVAYTGPGGDAELLGAFFADAGQHQEHRILVDHDQPHCKSRVTYRGALSGDKSHTVWIGDVVIRHDAVGTDTYELNRNLVLSGGARADSVPNLEIETGEVAGAGHASATGRFDDEQLFYLQARGIPAQIARRMVVHGFFADVIRRIEDSAIEARVLGAIDHALAGLDGAPGDAAEDLSRFAEVFEAAAADD